MRLSLLLASVLAVGAPPLATAAAPGDATIPPTVAAPGTTATPSAATSPEAARPWYAIDEGRHLGLQLDVGFPGGAAAEAVYRPWWWLRGNAGVDYNVLGFGLRAGVGVMPVRWTVTPSFNLDYGHFFGGDLNKFVTASSAAERTVLEDAAYDWLSGTIGLEFGSQQGFAFYVRGGLTYLWASVPGDHATALAQQQAPAGTIIKSSDVNVRGLLPSFSLGFIWYVY